MAFGPDTWQMNQSSRSTLTLYFPRLAQYLAQNPPRPCEQRRRSPRADLLTALVEATDGGDSLSESELTAMVVALVVAGHETTASTLAVSVYHLLNNPVEATRLRTQPVIYKTAIEELLRYDAATRGSVPRYAVDDIELGDRLVRKGDMIIVGNQASNHDPSVFEKPHSINLTRHPNKHISFFGGAHYCLGGWLARLELEAGLKGSSLAIAFSSSAVKSVGVARSNCARSRPSKSRWRSSDACHHTS
jgi:cytochrome P450